MPEYKDFIEAAALLATEDDSNPEYDRALAELIADVFGIPGLPLDDRAKQVMQDIRAVQEARFGV